MPRKRLPPKRIRDDAFKFSKMVDDMNLVTNKQKEKSSNIFDIGTIPKGIDSTLAVPSLFSKKTKGFDF